jgi:1,4-alpha-glucan branching enzyme
MKDIIHNPRRMGALPLEGGSTSFRVWAPNATLVSVVGEFNQWDEKADPLQREDGGMWAREVKSAKPGQQYQFYLENGDKKLTKNDPYVRDLHPKTRRGVIYDDGAFPWKTESKNVLANWNELVVYELHIGTFQARADGKAGGFDQVIARLPYLKNLGVNALEIMPPMAFPSKTSWGYSLTNPFAVEPSYGASDGFKRLIDAAHAQGIGIVLDIVINHFGPDDLDLWQYDGWSENNKGGIYFYNDERAWTPWGENRPDFGRGEVRQYLRDSCMVWLDAFQVDGLRMDATLFIRNIRGQQGQHDTDIPDGWTLMQWINEEAVRYYPKTLLVAEDLQRDDWITKPIRDGGLGYDTQWDPAFSYPIREAVVAIDDKNRSMNEVAGAIFSRYNNDFIQRMIYSESHDTVANGRSRIPQEIDPEDTAGYFARKRSTLAAGVLLTTPGIPMLFEGQEFLQDGWFSDEVAIDWKNLQSFKGINRLYHDLVHLRRNTFGNTKGLAGPHVQVHHVNDIDKVIAYHRWQEGGPLDSVVVLASFTNREFDSGYRFGLPHEGRWMVRFNSDWKGYSSDFHDVGQEEVAVDAEKEERDGFPFTGELPLGPYGFIVLSQEKKAAQEDDARSPKLD